MVFEEASTSTSDEVSRPVVPASPMRAALFFKLNKSGGGEARASRIDKYLGNYANPGSGTESAKETVETWTGLGDRGSRSATGLRTSHTQPHGNPPFQPCIRLLGIWGSR